MQHCNITFSIHHYTKGTQDLEKKLGIFNITMIFPFFHPVQMRKQKFGFAKMNFHYFMVFEVASVLGFKSKFTFKKYDVHAKIFKNITLNSGYIIRIQKCKNSL